MGQTRTGTIQNNLVSTFLVGGFVSNLGSLVFQIGFAIYAVQIGWPLAFVGLTLALCRYAQTGSNLLWGDLGDRANARSWLIATDIGGGLTDLAMVFISLHFAEFPQSGVLAVLLFRNLAMGLQVPLRAKIGKVLADQNPGASQNIAINLNIVAQGTTLFGAIFVLLLKRQTGFAGICVFDLVTFSLSALSSSLLPGYLFAESETSLRRAWAWKEKFRRYYNFNRGLFWRDVLISFPVWGTQALFLRVSGGEKDLVPYCWMIYGLSVIVTGQIAKSRWSEKLDRLSTAWFWFAQGLSFVFFMITASRFSLALIPLFLAYSFYFLALHNLSVQYQKRVGSESFAAIASARGIVAIFIISTGEMVVGWTASFLSVGGEGTIRSGFCLIVGIVIAIKSLTAGPK